MDKIDPITLEIVQNRLVQVGREAGIAMVRAAASLVVVEALAQFLGLEVDLGDLRQMAGKARQEMERFLMESRKEFIDRSTIPIWERRDEEEKA